MYKTVPFQIFNGNAKNNSFQLVLTAFHSSFFFFFSQKSRGFFFKVRGARSLVSTLERSRRNSEMQNLLEVARTTESFALSLAKSRGSWVWAWVWVNVVGKKKYRKK